ncbi:OmpA family protein [Desulfovibrio sp. OttesenSCG-928-M16]|nr:OmpA family protein [Desulfovibrio sp. OttesenSCG-928-M16]
MPEPTSPCGGGLTADPPGTARVEAAELESPVLAPAEEQSDNGWGDLPPEPGEPDLVALRSLLLRRELALLDRLKRRLDDPRLHARDVSDVIAEALLLRAGKDDKLVRSLEPVVENIFKTALRKNPLDFANALFPLMGPAIRRSIAEAFRSMLESVNKSVEMAFSWQGLRWRMEAWRSGKPFSELVLLNTLVYRVEQVFLIHSGSGLVLVHEAGEGVDSQDADMVSAMLTAIQDFVNDSFARGAEGELASLNLGDYTIMMEKSHLAYIACVVRGQPPADFRAKLRSSLEMILVEFYEDLQQFKGDTAPFSLAGRHLTDLMVARYVNEDRALPLWVKALPVILVLCLAGGAGYWSHLDSEAKKALRAERQAVAAQQQAFYDRMDDYVFTLNSEPGIVVREARRTDVAPWTLLCFKDEFARSPEEVLRDAGATDQDFVIVSTPYISLDPLLVRKRVEQTIQPPEGVNMSFDDNGVLLLSGFATLEWIMEARQKTLALPGVRQINLEGISDPRMERIKTLVSEVESVSIRFALGKDTPTPDDAPKLANAIDGLIELEKSARQMGLSVNLIIYGHTDSLGNPKRNYELSQSRANNLAAMLYAKGSTMSVTSYGMGADFAGQGNVATKGDPDSRRIELRVHLTHATGADELFSR